MKRVSGESVSVEGGTDPVDDGGMTRARWAVVGLALVLAVAVGVAIERSRGGVPKVADGPIGGAIRSVAKGVKDTATSVQDGVTGVKTSARNLGLEQQLVARLRGDRSIDSGRIEVSIEGEGTAVLDGLVADEDARERAIGLARDTRGVVRVVDHLAITPASAGSSPVVDAATADNGKGGPRR